MAAFIDANSVEASASVTESSASDDYVDSDNGPEDASNGVNPTGSSGSGFGVEPYRFETQQSDGELSADVASLASALPSLADRLLSADECSAHNDVMDPTRQVTSTHHPAPAGDFAPIPDDFSYETRFVVLNFLGHISPDSSLNSSQTNSLRSMRSQASSEEGPEADAAGDALSRLQNLPGVNMLERFHEVREPCQTAADVMERIRDVHHDAVMREVVSQAARPTRLPIRPAHPVHADLSSDGSDTSEPVSLAGLSARSLTSNTSVVEMQAGDVSKLVSVNALPAFAVPLREELGMQIEQLEHDSGVFPSRPGALTPESEVAYCLSLIGDRVQDDYSNVLGQLTQNILSMPREKVTYSVYRHIVNEMILSSTGWTRVALLLLLAQRVVFAVLSRGERGIGGLAEYTVNLIEESCAEFVVNSGGWSSICDVDSPVSATGWSTFPATPDEIRPPVTSRQSHLEAIQETDDPASCSDSAISVTTPYDSQGAALQTRDISMDSVSSGVWNESVIGDTDTPDSRSVPDSLSLQPLEGAMPHTTPSPISELMRNEIRLLRMYSDEIMIDAEDDQSQYRWWRTLELALAVTAVALAVIIYSKIRR